MTEKKESKDDDSSVRVALRYFISASSGAKMIKIRLEMTSQ
jgi:hypothetical protein